MRKWLNSAGHAWRGVLLIFKEERNARIELVIAVIAIVLSLWLRISELEWCLIIMCLGALLSAEALNTSIERLSDHASPEWNSTIRDVKDFAASGVFFISVASSLVGAIIFGPKIFFRLF